MKAITIDLDGVLDHRWLTWPARSHAGLFEGVGRRRGHVTVPVTLRAAREMRVPFRREDANSLRALRSARRRGRAIQWPARRASGLRCRHIARSRAYASRSWLLQWAKVQSVGTSLAGCGTAPISGRCAWRGGRTSRGSWPCGASSRGTPCPPATPNCPIFGRCGPAWSSRQWAVSRRPPTRACPVSSASRARRSIRSGGITPTTRGVSGSPSSAPGPRRSSSCRRSSPSCSASTEAPYRGWRTIALRRSEKRSECGRTAPAMRVSYASKTAACSAASSPSPDAINLPKASWASGDVERSSA